MNKCLSCDKKVKKSQQRECIACDEGPYCDKCTVKCECGQGPDHYLHGYNSKFTKEFDYEHACLFYDEEECGGGCGKPICDNGKLNCVVCMSNCSADKRFCNKHLKVVKKRLREEIEKE